MQQADSYRTHPSAESELATRTITTELNAHHDQYELTETITVPPEAAQHTEVVAASTNAGNRQTASGLKLLSNFGIKMLPEEDEDETSSALMQAGQTLSLTEAGKRILSDTSPMKALVHPPKYQTVEIKQEGSSTPKIIRINGSSLMGQSNSNSAQPRVIKLSSSQYNNLKLGTYAYIYTYYVSGI